jgi:Family of unknown function (DUF6116)
MVISAIPEGRPHRALHTTRPTVALAIATILRDRTGTSFNRLMTGSVVALVRRFARRWRYPRLLAVSAALLLADLVIPDVIPFVDEILLALLTLILARPAAPITSPRDQPIDRR